MRCYLKTGHKIGKPAPLFLKIEQQRLDELRSRYGGSQDSAQNGNSNAKETVFKSVQEAELAIKAQGDKIRDLKASKAEKSVIQPEVAILLSYKKQLEALTASSSSGTTPVTAPTTVPSAINNSVAIKELEKKISDQGEKVRQLKASGDKSVWQPQVDLLISLKNQLISLGGSVAAPPPTSGKKKGKK